MTKDMISWEQASDIIAGQCRHYGSEQKTLDDCMNYITAAPVKARIDSPAFTNSAMDGFAFDHSRISRMIQNGSDRFMVRSTVHAGDNEQAAPEPSGTVRIMTGAKMPPNCDTVIPLEHCQVINEKDVILEKLPPAGSNVRRKAENIQTGEELLPAGHLMDAFSIALCASQGIENIIVRKKPRISLLITGMEILNRNSNSYIHDANGPFLKHFLASMHFSELTITYVPDDLMKTADALQQAFRTSDVLISTGGVSMGDHDHIRPALQSIGANLLFWRIAQKPGKPMLAASYKDKLLFGLPGNPGAVMVNSCLYVYPFLNYYYKNDYSLIINTIPLASAQKNHSRRCHFRWGYEHPDKSLHIPPAQESYKLDTAQKASHLAVIEPSEDIYRKGEFVKCIKLDRSF